MPSTKMHKVQKSTKHVFVLCVKVLFCTWYIFVLFLCENTFLYLSNAFNVLWWIIKSIWNILCCFIILWQSFKVDF